MKSNIDDLLIRVRNATKFNLHTLARIEIADHFDLKVQSAKLNLMLKIQDLEGNCPRPLQDMRETWTIQMLYYIKTHFGEEIADRIEAEL